MRTASIREVRHDLSRILEWVANGEEVTITKRRRTVARLSPPGARKSTRKPMPDIGGRLQKVFGRKVISDQAVRAVLDESRGAY
jgi:antitoxin (DNA-binding transcriptional repressor) of toxin-antitoxin stability system